MRLDDTLRAIAHDATKANLEHAHLRGLYCYLCGQSTAEQSCVRERDGHVRHIRCGGELTNLETTSESGAARLLREGRY